MRERAQEEREKKERECLSGKSTDKKKMEINDSYALYYLIGYVHQQFSHQSSAENPRRTHTQKILYLGP